MDFPCLPRADYRSSSNKALYFVQKVHPAIHSLHHRIAPFPRVDPPPLLVPPDKPYPLKQDNQHPSRLNARVVNNDQLAKHTVYHSTIRIKKMIFLGLITEVFREWRGCNWPASNGVVQLDFSVIRTDGCWSKQLGKYAFIQSQKAYGLSF